jgi:hypothetical protein
VTPPSRIAFCGRKRSGKDTAALHLVRQHGYTPLALGDPLRALMTDVDPILWLDLDDEPVRYAEVVARYGYERAKDSEEVRRLLIGLGEGARSALGPGVWVRTLLERAVAVEGPIVVTDLRHPHDADTLRAYGFVIIRLSRACTEPAEPSEDQTDRILEDALCVNDGTLGELRQMLDELLLMAWK